jgi:hypothetical protein
LGSSGTGRERAEWGGNLIVLFSRPSTVSRAMSVRPPFWMRVIKPRFAHLYIEGLDHGRRGSSSLYASGLTSGSGRGWRFERAARCSAVLAMDTRKPFPGF